MKIESKFNIGDRVWVVHEDKKEVCVFSDYISDIMVSEGVNSSMSIRYWLKYADCDYFEENALTPYNNIDSLALKIQILDDQIINEQMVAEGEEGV